MLKMAAPVNLPFDCRLGLQRFFLAAGSGSELSMRLPPKNCGGFVFKLAAAANFSDNCHHM